MIRELALISMAAAEPHSGVRFKLTSGDLTQIPYVMAYTKCFESAAVEAKSTSPHEQQRRYEQCRASRPDLVTQYNAERPSHGPQAKRGFVQSLNVIEKAYADALAKQSKRD